MPKLNPEILKKFIVESKTEPIPLIDEVAAACFISTSAFKRAFKAEFGVSYYEFFLRNKMEHARLLLLTTKLKVTDIAFEVNYEKTSQFIAMFKRHFGNTPHDYRLKHRLPDSPEE